MTEPNDSENTEPESLNPGDSLTPRNPGAKPDEPATFEWSPPFREAQHVTPSKMPKYARNPDRWDKQDWQHVIKEIDEVSAARNAISGVAKTGSEALADSFWTFSNVEPEILAPEQMRPSFRVNQVIASEMEQLPDTQRLRRSTVGDTVGSAMAAVTIEPDLETLFDRLKKQQAQAEAAMSAAEAAAQAEQEAFDLDEVIEKWMKDADPNNPDDQNQAKDYQKQWEEMQERLDSANSAAQQASDELDQSLEDVGPTIRTALRDAMGKAADEANQMQQAMDSWGTEPGQLQRMPAKERMELAKRLNTPRFKKIADLFGAMRNLMLTIVSRKTIAANEEIFDVIIGDELERVLPEELIALDIEELELEFYRRMFDGELLVYEMKGKEKKAQGGIVMMEDGSGSMSGERELWAKAVMLTLMHLARMQKRPFHLIHFGSRNQFKTLSFMEQSDYTINNVLDAAEIHFGGGTDFQTPLDEGLRLLEAEYSQKGAVEGDMVFVTDGMCGVSDDWFKNFKERQTELDFVIWGVGIGCGKKDEPMAKICDNRVCSVKDLLSGGDITAIFGDL